MEHEGDGDTNDSSCSRKNPKKSEKETGWSGNLLKDHGSI